MDNEKTIPTLELSVELLSEAIRSFPEAILIKNLRGDIILGSQQVADFFGIDIDDLPGSNVYDLLPKTISETVRAKMKWIETNRQSNVSEEVWEFEHDTRTLLVSRAPVRNPRGEVVGVMTGYRNVSPIKQAFALYEQNQHRFVTLAKTCPVGIFECNPFHQVTYVNPEWERITGVASSDILGKEWLGMLSAEHQLRVQTILGPSETTRPSISVDCLIHGKDQRWVELSINHCMHEDGNSVSYIGSMVDLTSRLEAQKQLEEQVNLMRELTSAVPAIIWQLSLDGRCIFISDHWRVVSGSSPQDAIRNGWMQSVHPEDRSAVEKNLNDLLTSRKQSCSFECRLLGGARDWRWTLVAAQQIHSMEGELRGVVGNTIDITERMKAQEKLLELNTSLEQRVLDRTQALLQANEALKIEIEHRRHTEEMLEEKRSELDHVERLSLAGQLSGELAHELNQPLNAIQNYVGSLSLLASNLPHEDSAVKIISQLNKEISRAAKIIKRTRDFVSTGKHQPEQIDICEIILDTAAMLKGESRRRGMQIQVKMDSQTSPFLGDKVGLQQVLVNLILNAIDSMVGRPASDKIVLVEMINQSDRIIIAVRDTGSGVPESEVKKLFDAFFTTKSTGLGMGLAISQRIIESHRGTLRYEPREDCGSSFVIELPFLEKASGEKNTNDTKAKSS